VTNPEQAPDIDLEAEELTDENLEEVSGGAATLTSECLDTLGNNPAGNIYALMDGRPHQDTLLD
jgi:hypothetical protein